MSNFWKKLPRPFVTLAPLEDVTDVVFREIMTILPKPDVMFTEFTSADAIQSPGRDITMRKFQFTENQHPIVAQIWGVNPENLYKTAVLIRELKFDGIDINMGCPDKSVMKKGLGGKLCTNQPFAKEVIDAVKKGAGSLPISVKTRLGYNSIITDEWIPFLLKQGLDALTIHGRVATQMSRGEANWDEIGKAVKHRDDISPETVIIGNGDIKNYSQVLEMHKKYKVDGVMIGRGVFSDPWIFSKNIAPVHHDKSEYIEILLKHLQLHKETWGNTKHFEIMKKFFKMYIKDFKGANLLRQRLMECKNESDVLKLISSE